MSGIFGILHFDGRPVDQKDLDLMKNSLSFLGPDGGGTWKEGPIGMGHLLRVSTPESVFERLTFRSKSEDLIITAAARLDNRGELLKALEIPYSNGLQMPDSALIIESYQKWGEYCVRRFLGAFVFAIWDKREKKLICARDHTGIRSFFYYLSDKKFIFASAIKGVLSIPFIPIKLNEEALAATLLPIEKDSPQTFFQDIVRLKAAHILKVQEKKLSITPYWEPQPKRMISFSSDEDYALALKEIFVKAVRCRLKGKLPAGVLLSGGLDSSSVACIAARKLREKGETLVSVSSVLPEDHFGVESDERSYINRVIEQEQNIDARYVTAEEAGPYDDLDKKFSLVGLPVNAFHYMDQALANALSERGVSTVLSGFQGDATASYDGRDSIAQLFRRFEWEKLFRLIPLLKQSENKSYSDIIRNYLLKYLAPTLYTHLAYYLKGKWRSQDDYYITPFSKSFQSKHLSAREKLNLMKEIFDKGYWVRHLSKIQFGSPSIEYFILNHAFFGQDIRFPFWDKRLIEFLISVPPEQFLLGGWKRSLFRRAMEGILPKKIQWRTSKHPYTPDFHRRVISRNAEVKEFLETLESSESVKKYVCSYIDTIKIQQQLGRIQRVSGRSDWESKTQCVVVSGIIFIKFLMWMNTLK